MEWNRDQDIARALHVINSLTDDEIAHYSQWIDPVLHRIDSRRRRPKSGTLTAINLLSMIEKLAQSTSSTLDRNMVEFVGDAMQKQISSEDPQLAFCSISRTPSQTDCLVYVQSILHHTHACYGSNVDHLARSSSNKSDGQIGAYCDRIKADRDIMERCLIRGSKLNYLQQIIGEVGVAALIAPIVASLSQVSWSELRKVPDKISQYPLIPVAARAHNNQFQKTQIAYR